MSQSIPILVVGAGPVGLTFASEMARYGIPCRIVDKAQGTKDISKALILHVRTQEVLDAMGMTHEFAAVANPMRRVEIIGYGKHIGHGDMEGIHSPHPYPLILGQNVTEATRVEQDEDAVTATLRHANGSEEKVRAHYVMGADGTRSLVRQQTGIEFTGNHYEGQAFIQADSKIRWSLPGGVSYLWFTKTGYMMVIEMPNGQVRTFISVPDPGSDQKNTTLEEVNEALNRLGGLDAQLYDPTWVALFRVNHRAASQFRKGRVFIAGDAAHEHVPIGGQGMNTSIQDAFNLAWKLAYVMQGKAAAGLLDSYQIERHPVAESLLRGTDEAYTNLLKAGDIGRAAIRLLGPFLLASQTVREKMRNTLEEIEINYRKGPLTSDHGGSKGPHAGDRLRNAKVVAIPQKETKALFDLLRGTKWNLLLFSGREPELDHVEHLIEMGSALSSKYADVLNAQLIVGGYPFNLPATPKVSVLADPMNQAHDEYGVDEPCLYLVRPDWYIAFRGGLANAYELNDYLERAFAESKQAVHGA
jgi:3-(3-hydroxy-phenyl)propionate hydroxylase